MGVTLRCLYTFSYILNLYTEEAKINCFVALNKSDLILFLYKNENVPQLFELISH